MSNEPPQPDYKTLALGSGETIAYRHRPGSLPGILFLGGFMSDMSGTKATHLLDYGAASGRSVTTFDYLGHGLSSGAFESGTIGNWGNDALAVFDQVTEGPQILVGSSMGGWIMLLLARARPERIAGLVGIAPAPDFTEALIWDQLPPDQRDKLMAEGRLEQPSDYGEAPYIITRALIEEGRNHLQLHAPIPLSCPVRLLHGLEDRDVPYEGSLALADALESSDVEVTLVKGGDHRLSSDGDLALLDVTLDRLLADGAPRRR
ncbi:MAG: alpha/beta hydrolase [Rhodospirillales bacterium]